jgi:hypothetical protein
VAEEAYTLARLKADQQISMFTSRRTCFDSSFFLVVEEAYTQQGRAHIRRLHPDWAARPALMRFLLFFSFSFFSPTARCNLYGQTQNFNGGRRPLLLQ